jgi:hypothetical protein
MWGESQTPISEVKIRIQICDAFAQLSHPPPQTVEWTGCIIEPAPFVGMNRISSLAIPNVCSVQSVGKALSL